ncbi:cytochrome P450 [Dictyobacter arantiisoli]|uniref:Cytochrome P450 n=1 Tax=Dictyobacter arantiisoli TaxID=2014874 RepID=A0A5A5TJ84_9CHLR|nr:cytochrome P450 [Dictyobacter arantiisoli]GCF11063.1 cytochrome P450 [Dictyobacter arantiisoli]
MAQENTKLFQQILDHSHITHPYPIYAQLRETPVCQQEDGTYVVSTYADVMALLRDPRVSSDERKSADLSKVSPATTDPEFHPTFIFQDPPAHDLLRRLVVNQFTPERIEGLRPHIEEVVQQQLEAHRQTTRMDIVDDLAYPLPVSVICRLLGVPIKDEDLFHGWSTILASTLDPGQTGTEEQKQKIIESSKQLREYLRGLVNNLRAHPEDNLLSDIIKANETEKIMTEDDIVATAGLLLIAGHETTVNLITNGMLTLLRQPEIQERLRQEPDLIISFVEEMLRYDPPVQFRTRTTLAAIDIDGITIPKGASLVLIFASGSHDPARFERPEECIPERTDNQHLGFGGGIHYCVGAPLARIEAQIALRELNRRLIEPKLDQEPPPYRANASLRGPRHLTITYKGLRP